MRLGAGWVPAVVEVVVVANTGPSVARAGRLPAVVEEVVDAGTGPTADRARTRWCRSRLSHICIYICTNIDRRLRIKIS